MRIELEKFTTATHYTDPYGFLSIEKKTLESVGKKEGALLFYVLGTPAILLGSNQKQKIEADIPVIKRLTSGTAVWFSDNQIAMTLMFDYYSAFGFEKRRDIYCYIDSLILQGIVDAGVDAEMAKLNCPQPEYRSSECFKAVGKCEVISSDGRKLAGTSYKVISGIYVHQAMIYLDDSYKMLSRYTGEEVPKNVASIRELNPNITRPALESSISKRITSSIGGENVIHAI